MVRNEISGELISPMMAMPRGSAVETLRAAHPDPRRGWLALWVSVVAFLGLTHMLSGAAGLALQLATHRSSPMSQVPLWQSVLPWLIGVAIALPVSRMLWRALRP